MRTTIEGTLELASKDLSARVALAEREARSVATRILEESSERERAILALESAITPRRLREALYGHPESGAFIAVLNNAIDDLRAKEEKDA